LADLTSLLLGDPGTEDGAAAVRAAGEGVPTGLCKVPLTGALASPLGSSFFATNTFLGAFIMLRIASASAKALRRRASSS
jgi:hypothetical protein